VCIRAKRQVKQALKLYEGRGFGGLAQLCMGKVEEMCEVGGMGEEEATLETVEAGDEPLVAQEELKKGPICVRIVILDELVEAFKLRVSVGGTANGRTEHRPFVIHSQVIVGKVGNSLHLYSAFTNHVQILAGK